MTVPDGVTEIGMRAFKNCAAITEIVLPESLEVIGFDAFFGCTGLRQMFLPKGVREIVEHQERPENVSLTDYCIIRLSLLSVISSLGLKLIRRIKSISPMRECYFSEEL